MLAHLSGTICLKHSTTLILSHLLKLPSRCTCLIIISKLFFTIVPIPLSDIECVRVCVVSVIVKHPVLPPCVIDGHSRNPLYYYYFAPVYSVTSFEAIGCICCICNLPPAVWQNNQDLLRATVVTQVEQMPKYESAEKVNPGEEKFPAAPGTQTWDLSITSLSFYHCSLCGLFIVFKNRKPPALIVYTDGSVTKDQSGWGFTVNHPGRQFQPPTWQ